MKENINDGNYQIYIIKIKMADGSIQDRYAVPDRDRKTGQGFGDTLFKTKEEAEEEVVFNRKKDSEDIKRLQHLAEKERIKKEQKAIRDNIDGFADGLSPMQKGKVISILNKQMRFNGTIMAIKDKVKEMIIEGVELHTAQENVIKNMTRTQWNRADQKQQDLHEKRMRESGKKTVYYVGNYDLGETAYSYAQYLVKEIQKKIMD